MRHNITKKNIQFKSFSQSFKRSTVLSLKQVAWSIDFYNFTKNVFKRVCLWNQLTDMSLIPVIKDNSFVVMDFRLCGKILYMCIKYTLFGKYRHKITHYKACDECKKKKKTNLVFVNLYPVVQVLFQNRDVM